MNSTKPVDVTLQRRRRREGCRTRDINRPRSQRNDTAVKSDARQPLNFERITEIVGVITF